MENNILLYDKFNFNKFVLYEKHYTDQRDGCPYNYIAFMLSGSAKIVSKDKTIYIKQGDVFHIPINLSYQSYWEGKEIKFLSLGYKGIGIANEKKYELQIVNCDDSIKDILLKIPTVGKNITCEALAAFYAAAAKILPLMSEKNESMTEKIKTIISENPTLSMPSVASIYGISTPYLYMLFKKSGETPNLFRQRAIVQKGINLLLTTDKKLDEIAGIVGVSSAAYLRKILKSHTGKTPKEIRAEREF